MNTQITTQLWIVRLLRRYQQLTFAQINQHWQAQTDLSLSPLHPSQTEAEVDADTSLFCLQCHATPDLRLAILRQGSLVEVLEPQQLRTDVADEVRRLAQVYGVV